MNSSEALNYANEFYLAYHPKEPPYNDEGGVDPLSDRKGNMDTTFQCKENAAKKILKRIEAAARINPNLSGFRVRYDKNDRGDYGVTKNFSYNALIFLIVDHDGAHQDTHYYTTINTEAALSLMEKDAKENK